MSAQWLLTDAGGGAAWALTDVETPDSAAVAPASVTATVTGGTTKLIEWVPGAGGGAPEGFDVQIETPAGSGTWAAASGAANPTAAGVASFGATGLTVATAYGYRVRAKRTGFADSAWTTYSAAVTTDNSVTGGAVIGAADTTAPTLSGSITIAALTSTGYTATCPTGSDAVGVSGYQWRLGGTGAWTDIASGGRTATFTGRTPASTDALEMRCRDAAGNFSNVLSTSVTLLGIAPAVTTQPTSASVVSGATATFTAAFSGTPTPTLQWTRNGAVIAGATSSSYSFTATLGDTGAVFTCTATNSAGSVTTNAAVLTVTAVTVAPSIVTQPASQTIIAGAQVTFSVVAAGTTPLAYQWQRNGVAISGATSSSYTFTADVGDDGAAFSVVVSNAAGSVSSAGAVLAVSETNLFALASYTLLAPFDQVDNLGGFAPKAVDAKVTLAFDFRRFTSAPQSVTVDVTRYRGAADDTPNAIKRNAAAILGTKVFQAVQDGVAHCDYKVRAVVTAADGSQYPMEGILPVRPS